MPRSLADIIEPEVPRDRYGRPMIVPPEGGKPIPYTRCSTFAQTLSDAGGLVKYVARLTALGMARSVDLCQMAAPLEYGMPELDEIIETAQDRAGGSAKANRGTALHTATNPAVNRALVPAEVEADAEAYRTAIREAGLAIVATERFVVNDDLKVAGTFDNLLGSPLVDWTAISDKKTGKLHPLDVAIQLATYAGGFFYELDGDGDPVRSPLPNVSQEFGVLAHVPAGEARCDLYRVDLERGRAYARLALQIRAARRDEPISPWP